MFREAESVTARVTMEAVGVMAVVVAAIDFSLTQSPLSAFRLPFSEIQSPPVACISSH